jgi:anion-transporting  ArsA/GET3 family ATPase
VSEVAAGGAVNSLQQRILIVTGKGGVGKTTVSLGIAMAAARAGLRTIVTETSGARTVPAVFGVEGTGYAPFELQPRLWTLSITPEEAIEDYVVQQIKIRALFKLVFRNRIMGPFVDAVPGLHDAVQLGKVFDLEREQRRGRPAWDLIVVDAPATGHGLTMLSSARSMMELTRAGPLHEGVRRVDAVLGDPVKTGLVLVALPEEMPVNETLELWGRLGPGQAQTRMMVLNQVHDRPPAMDHWDAAAPALRSAGSPALAEAADTAGRWVARVRQQDAARERLAAGVGAPLVDLPWTGPRAARPDQLAALGERLWTALEAR